MGGARPLKIASITPGVGVSFVPKCKVPNYNNIVGVILWLVHFSTGLYLERNFSLGIQQFDNSPPS